MTALFFTMRLAMWCMSIAQHMLHWGFGISIWCTRVLCWNGKALPQAIITRPGKPLSHTKYGTDICRGFQSSWCLSRFTMVTALTVRRYNILICSQPLKWTRLPTLNGMGNKCWPKGIVGVPVLCGWDSNYRSGITPAMRHRLCCLSTCGLSGLRKMARFTFTSSGAEWEGIEKWQSRISYKNKLIWNSWQKFIHPTQLYYLQWSSLINWLS